jgi:hypothetical protein
MMLPTLRVLASGSGSVGVVGAVGVVGVAGVVGIVGVVGVVGSVGAGLAHPPAINTTNTAITISSAMKFFFTTLFSPFLFSK